MKSKTIYDLQDPSDSHLGGDGAEVFTNLFPLGNLPPALAPTVPAETVEAQSAQNGSGGSGSVVSETAPTGIGMTINLEFDAAAMASTPAAATFRAGIEQAASMLSATITDKITVNIAIDYSGVGGSAAAGPDTGAFVDYSTVRADLVDGATKGDPTFSALPMGPTIQNKSLVAVWDAQLKLFGLPLPSSYTGIDGDATFTTDIPSNLLVGVALHELTHALGRVPYGPQPDIFDFYRFTSAGSQLFAGGTTAPATYFSVDGGFTKIADYGQTSDPSDFLNSGVQGFNDAFNEFYSNTTIQGLTTIDQVQLDALGFHLASPLTTTVQTDNGAFGSTNLVQFLGSYYFENSSGLGPDFKFGGTAFVAGEFGAWTLIGAVQVSGGYDIAWKVPGADQYTIWNTDSNGNFVSALIGTVSGTSTALESFEPLFHQDLNGDGTIGFTTQVIESFGSTSLKEVGNNFYFYNSSGSGPEFMFGGAPFVAGEFGAWTLIGAEQVAGGGYDIAWKVPGADQYTVWSTDSNGNFVSALMGTVSGTSTTLESFETLFHQDLNGDGVIGVTTKVIESVGSTSLTEVGNNFFFDNSSGSGPEFVFNGAPFFAGEFGAWTLIGAEQVAGGGYDIAFKVAGADQYTVWSTDSNGNFVSALIGTVSGASTALESFEPLFHQDLNIDGVTGVKTTVIEAFGSTSLTEVGNNFFFDNSGGSGPEFVFNGTPFFAGEFGAWTLIGAEQVAGGGYDIAFKVAGADQYTVWSTDSNGNFVSALIGTVSGTSSALESFKSTFHQDLNGDGIVGVPVFPSSLLMSAQANSATATFTGSTLTLDEPSAVSVQIVGFAGDGTLQGSDQIDLHGMNYNSVHSEYDSSTGILFVIDGTSTTDLQFLGSYSEANFKFADDGSGGSILFAQTGSSQPSKLGGGGAAPTQVTGNNFSAAGSDTFIFAPDFGKVTLAHFTPETDTIQVNKAVFANIDALFAATHDDSLGNAVITDAAHDTITI